MQFPARQHECRCRCTPGRLELSQDGLDVSHRHRPFSHLRVSLHRATLAIVHTAVIHRSRYSGTSLQYDINNVVGGDCADGDDDDDDDDHDDDDDEDGDDGD